MDRIYISLNCLIQELLFFKTVSVVQILLINANMMYSLIAAMLWSLTRVILEQCVTKLDNRTIGFGQLILVIMLYVYPRESTSIIMAY